MSPNPWPRLLSRPTFPSPFSGEFLHADRQTAPPPGRARVRGIGNRFTKCSASSVRSLNDEQRAGYHQRVLDSLSALISRRLLLRSFEPSVLRSRRVGRGWVAGSWKSTDDLGIPSKRKHRSLRERYLRSFH